jgi:acyl-CoA synthetase (AMP-forming)/AMP-acid ligase II
VTGHRSVGHLRLELPPDWASILAIWDDCHRFLKEHGFGADHAYKLTMTVQELLENAVKYGSFRSPSHKVALRVDLDLRQAEIEVTAPADPDPASLERLQEVLRAIRQHETPLEAYVENLRKASEPDAGHRPGGGLGLARIAYEAQCELDFRVDESRRLSITAVHRRGVGTLAGLLESAAHHFPRMTFHSISQGRTFTAPELWERACQVGARLLDRGVRPGEPVGVLLPNSLELLAAYFGVFACGAAVAPLAVPPGLKNMEASLARLQHIIRDGRIRHLVTGRELGEVLSGAGVPVEISTPEMLLQGSSQGVEAQVSPHDLAVVQYTSGSTASPKGVALSHAQASAGIRAIVNRAKVTSSDVLYSWLPMSHDMGLVSSMVCLTAGADVYFSTPSAFIKRPDSWLEGFARAGATLYSGPNFSYQYLIDGVDEETRRRLDLSRWRLACNGAEMIDPLVLERFIATFGPCGFKPETMFPVYGLAEATLAVTFPDLGEPPVIEWVDRAVLANQLEVELVPRTHRMARGVVSVGRPVQGLEVRICRRPDASFVTPERGAEVKILPEHQVGEIEVRGESVMQGYYRAPDQTKEVLRGGWLATGDLGYLSGGRLYVTGRTKEFMKLRGENYFPEDVEAMVKDLPGVYRHRCTAFVVLRDASERMVVLLETDLESQSEQKRLGSAARQRVATILGIDAFDVYLVRPRSILLTTSGKYQRLLMRDRVVTGAIEHNLVGIY